MNIFPSFKSIAIFFLFSLSLSLGWLSCLFLFLLTIASSRDKNIKAMLKGHKHTVNSGNRVSDSSNSNFYIHSHGSSAKKSKSSLNLCSRSLSWLSEMKHPPRCAGLEGRKNYDVCVDCEAVVFMFMFFFAVLRLPLLARNYFSLLGWNESNKKKSQLSRLMMMCGIAT